jgi:hypothetical protein
MFSEERDITPAPNFAGKKSSGHSLLSALKDNLDNHFDSESSVIKCFLAPDLQNPKQTVLITLDFGTGILPDKIHKMYVDNYSTKNGENRWTANKKRRNLGRFGNGIKNVVGRIAGSVLTISKVDSHPIFAVEYDPARCEILQDYKATVWEVVYGTESLMVETLRQYWLDYMVDEYGQVASHGTINIFRNLNSEVLTNLKSRLNYDASKFTLSYGASFGETFAQFLNEGDRLYVGTDFNELQEVLPLNPVAGAIERFSKTFEFSNVVNSKFETVQMKCSIYEFPEGVQSYRPTTVSHAGVYINRNGRLHLNKKDRPITTDLPDTAIEKLKASGISYKTNTSWDAFPSGHSRYAKIRVVIEMTSDLDEAFGVNNIKTEMSLTSVLDEVSAFIYTKTRAVDPFKGRMLSTPAQLFEKYVNNHKKHVDQSLRNALSYIQDPEELSKVKKAISEFTRELGEQIG